MHEIISFYLALVSSSDERREPGHLIIKYCVRSGYFHIQAHASFVLKLFHLRAVQKSSAPNNRTEARSVT